MRLASAYVAVARGVGAGLARCGLGGDPPPTGHRGRQWLWSLGRVHDPDALVRLGLPWWTYRASDAVDDWLTGRRRPVRVFEYGCGASTVWLAARADEVISVEHDAAFAHGMAQHLADLPHVHLSVVTPCRSPRPTTPSGRRGYSGLDFTDYVTSITAAGGHFDLIVIDGRARAACLTAAIPALARDGIIVFDNTARLRYRSAVRAGGLAERRLRGLTPGLPYPEQTSILGPSPLQGRGASGLRVHDRT